MMEAGRARNHQHVEWKLGAAERLPLADASTDTITIAFGIRAPGCDRLLRYYRKVSESRQHCPG